MTPGWFGKLPGIGDFAHRRLPDAFLQPWDRWLQNGLARLRVRHADWTAHYLEAPLWCFVLGDDVIGGQRWLGVLMPSVDAVGRYFPLAVVAELDASDTELWGDTLAHARHWWARAMQAALEGLEHDLDASRFEAVLERLFGDDAEDLADSGAAGLALPEFGHSLWFTDPTGESGLGMASKGLPQDDQFEALFGAAADVPQRKTGSS